MRGPMGPLPSRAAYAEAVEPRPPGAAGTELAPVRLAAIAGNANGFLLQGAVQVEP